MAACEIPRGSGRRIIPASARADTLLRRVVPALTAAFTLLAGCEKDHEPVTSFHQNLEPPVRVQAAWTETGEVRVTWEMEAVSDAHGFLVTLSHRGNPVYERAVEGAGVRSFTSSGLDTGGIAADEEETDAWLLVRVRAYDRNLFQGPPSEPDSVQVGP